MSGANAKTPATPSDGRWILNVGCGTDTYGTHRLDLDPASPTATEIGSAVALPYRDAVFDEVYAANVLEHLPNPLLFLQEARRVLKPGGRLVCITDHAGYLGYHLVGLRAADNHLWSGVPGDRHYMLFNTGHVRNLMEAAGLEVGSVELFSKWAFSLRARLMALFARPLAMPNIRIVAMRPTAPAKISREARPT